MRDGCKVKICGITNKEDAELAAGAGADFLGVVVEVSFSPRSLTIEAAREIFVNPPRPAVALVYQMPLDRVIYLIETLRPAAVQFLSPAAEIIALCKELAPGPAMWQSVHLPPSGELADLDRVHRQVAESCAAGADVVVYDTAAVIKGESRFGGTGRPSDWQLVRRLVEDCPVPAFLAGGIDPDNVGEAIRLVQPAGIDLCSGVEAVPGKKSAEKIRALMDAAGKGMSGV